MERDRKTSEKIFDFFPSMISGNPKKIIAVIVIFTLVMGYFAAQLEMDIREESFEPETEKGEWLSEIRSDFGRAGESIQIAFVADDDDVFTRAVMEDMLRTKGAVIEDEKVNQTLLITDEIPEGMTTLADTVLTVDVALELEEILIERSIEISDLRRSMENQSAMYSSMETSLDNVSELVHSSDSRIQENATMKLTSMGNIISRPRTWMVLSEENYAGEFKELIDLMTNEPSPSNTQEIIQLSTSLIEDMEEDDLTPGTDQHHFVGLVEGMRNVFMNEPSASEYQYNVQSFLHFIEIGNHIPHIETDLSLETETPELDMSIEDKKERLGNMTDEDIKETVKGSIEHDPVRLEDSIDNAINDLGAIKDNSEDAVDSLEETDDKLEDLIGFYLEKNGSDILESLERYRTSVIENKTLLERTSPMYDSIASGMRSARFLPTMIDQLGNAITRTVSRDFMESDLENDEIKAKSTIALIQMNTSFSRDVRREAQREIITIGEDNTFNSSTRVFAQQIMMEEIEDSSNRSMNTLLPIAFIFVVVVLFFVYRTVVETILSLLSLGVAIIWTFGFGVLLGYEFNPMIIAVPVLITGLVIDYGIHMVMRYREEKEKGKKSSLSTMVSISTVGGALLLTSLTTAIGFSSNTFSNLSAMQQFGVLAAVGIIFSFVLMVTFLPSVIQLVDEWRDTDYENNSSKGISRGEGGLISSLLSRSTDASDRHPWVVIFVVALITISGVYGVANIDTTFDIQDFLPEHSSQAQNINYIQDNFDISTSFVYILSEGDMTDPVYLRAVDRTIENARESELVMVEEGTISPLKVLRDFGMAVEGSSNYDPEIVENFTESNIPEDVSGWDEEGAVENISAEKISQLYDLLFEKDISRRSISNVLYRENGTYTKGIIRFRENTPVITANLDNAKVMEQDLIEASGSLREEDYTTKITSGNIIGQQTTEELTSTQINSLFATIIVVAVLLSLVFYYLHGSKVLGIITTLPVTVVTIWIVGTMYMIGVSLNVMTVSITALTVGMGIDYSIHITHRFIEEKEEEDDLFDAMHDTVQNTGAALFGSAATTVGAFAILATSDILPLSQFGYITALAITYSFLVAVFVLPSALMLWAKCCKDQERKDLPVLKKKRR